MEKALAPRFVEERNANREPFAPFDGTLARMLSSQLATNYLHLCYHTLRSDTVRNLLWGFFPGCDLDNNL